MITLPRLLSTEELARKAELYSLCSTFERTYQYKTRPDNEQEVYNANLSEFKELAAKAGFQEKLNTVQEYLDLYFSLRGAGVELSAETIDEVLGLILDIANKTTRGPEVALLSAKMVKTQFDAYVTVGFSEDQAMLFILKSMDNNPLMLLARMKK